jgi:hypothetical protein
MANTPCASSDPKEISPMKKTVLTLLLAASLQGFSALAAASPVVIGFDSLMQDNDQTNEIGNVYRESGFEFSNLSNPFSFASFGTQNPFFNGSTALFNDNTDGQTRLSQIGGGLFSLSSITLSTLAPGYTEEGTSVTFTGLLATGGSVMQSFNVADGAAQTFSFSPNFSNLSAVTWSNEANFHQFDNITVAAVPEPETYALMLSGLGLVAFAARRRSK